MAQLWLQLLVVLVLAICEAPIKRKQKQNSSALKNTQQLLRPLQNAG
nr:MAG TPA: hypothetical protein [Caudoviricetes sp.]